MASGCLRVCTPDAIDRPWGDRMAHVSLRMPTGEQGDIVKSWLFLLAVFIALLAVASWLR